MTQRQTFTKEMILDAAFTLVREKGWQAVTARNIAQALGASTMPIYSSVRSMEEVAQELGMRTFDLMQDYQKRSWTENPTLNLAVGYVMFAKREPALFKFMYQERPNPIAFQDFARQAEFLTRSFSTVPGVTERMKELSQVPMEAMILNSWVYTHGLATLVSNKVLDVTDQQIAQLLQEAGGAFYVWGQSRARENKQENRQESKEDKE